MNGRVVSRQAYQKTNNDSLIDEKELPQSVDGYREMLRKYLMIHNGRLLKEFDKLYKLLHIAGYYRGLLEDVTVVKDASKAAKIFIEEIK